MMTILKDWEFWCPADQRKLQDRQGHLRSIEDTVHHNIKMSAGLFKSGWHMGMKDHYC